MHVCFFKVNLQHQVKYSIEGVETVFTGHVLSTKQDRGLLLAVSVMSILLLVARGRDQPNLLIDHVK